MINNPILPPDIATGDPVALVESGIVTFINLLYVVGVVWFFFMLVWGGIEWISSGSDQQKLANAKSRIQNAVIGLVLMMAAFAVVTIIETIFGVNILVIEIGDLSL